MILSSLLMELCKWKEEFIDNSAVEAYRFVLWVDGIFQAQWQGNERIWLLFYYLGMKHRQRAKHHVPTWTISSSAFKWRVAAWWLLYEVASYFWPLWELNTVMYRNDVWLVVVYLCWTGIVWCLLRFSEVLFLLIDFSQSRQRIIFNLL